MCVFVFFFKLRMTYEMRISAWSSDVCASDLPAYQRSEPMSQLLPSLVELDHHAQAEPEFATWRVGFGPFEHALEPQAAVFRLAHPLVQAGRQPDLARSDERRGGNDCFRTSHFRLSPPLDNLYTAFIPK